MNAITDIIPVTRINYLMIDQDGKLIQDFEIDSLQDAIDLLPEISETFAVARVIELETGGGVRPNAVDYTAHVLRMVVNDRMESLSNMSSELLENYKGVFGDAVMDLKDNNAFEDDGAPTLMEQHQRLKRAYQGR